MIRRALSLSLSERDEHNESTSSMKMIEGCFSRAIWNRFFTSLYEKSSILAVLSFDSLLTLAQPFGDEIGTAHREESRPSGFCSDCLRNKALACARRSKEEDAAPWLAIACNAYYVVVFVLLYNHQQQIARTSITVGKKQSTVAKSEHQNSHATLHVRLLRSG